MTKTEMRDTIDMAETISHGWWLDDEKLKAFEALVRADEQALAAQRQWVGLTDEEIWKTISRIGTSDSDVNPYAKLADARAIEAKLKEKNT
jgi:hypothetical protein